MNVAIVGDVHLSLRRYPEFEANRFKLLIDELIKQNPKAIIFAGDLLDTNRPTLEEQKLLLDAFHKLKYNGIKVKVISGNHEALTNTTNVYDYILPHNAEYIRDSFLYVMNTAPNHINTGIRMISWTDVKFVNHEPSNDILVTHLRANHGLLKEEFDIQKLSECYEQVFMGDLHFRYSPFKNVHYTSSPYTTKFSPLSSLKDCGFIMLDTVTREWKYIDLDLPSKIKIECSFKDLQDVRHGLEKHLLKVYVSGTLEELKSIPTEDNVIYVKLTTNLNVQQLAQSVQVKVQNPLDGIYKHIDSTDFNKRYPNSSDKVKLVVEKVLNGNK